MLMICSSLARNRSPDPVVLCCFGRIVPSDAAKKSWFSLKENRKTELHRSAPQVAKPCNLKLRKAQKIDSYSIV